MCDAHITSTYSCLPSHGIYAASDSVFYHNLLHFIGGPSSTIYGGPPMKWDCADQRVPLQIVMLTMYPHRPIWNAR